VAEESRSGPTRSWRIRRLKLSF